MKKEQLYILLFLLLPLGMLAQQQPLFTQSTFNNFGINPAFAGAGECVDLKVGYRHQWTGFEGNPQTAFFNGNGKILKKRNNRRTSFFGVGGRIYNDQAGPYNFIQLELGAAYHVKLGTNVYGSFGLFAGIIQNRFDVSGLTLTNFNDPAIAGSSASIVYPAITPGLLIYNSTFYIGMSIQNIVNVEIPEVGLNTRTARHYIFKAAKSFRLSDRAELVPSIVTRYAYSSPLGYDVNLIYKLDKKYQLGVSYRNQTAIAALLNVKIFNMFSIGYSFDYIINNISYGTYGSHEIIVGFNTCDFTDKSIVRCAAFD